MVDKIELLNTTIAILFMRFGAWNYLSSQEQCIIVKYRVFSSPSSVSPGWMDAGHPKSCCLELIENIYYEYLVYKLISILCLRRIHLSAYLQHLSLGPYAPRWLKLFALHPPPHQFVPGIRTNVSPRERRSRCICSFDDL